MEVPTLDQICSAYLTQDWTDEFASPYEAFEEHLVSCEDGDLHGLISEITSLMTELGSERERLDLLPKEGLWQRPEGYVDAWLLAVRRRAEQALAGDHSQPLTDPNGPAYDQLPPFIGGWLHDEQAEQVAGQVLAAHAGYVQLLEQADAPRSVVMRSRISGERTVQLRDTGEVVPAPYGCVVLHRLVRARTVFVEPEREPEPGGLPALGLFLGSYLRPGWWEKYSNPLEGILVFRREQGVELTAAALIELPVLQGYGQEDDRRELLQRLGSYFVPRREGEVDAFLWAMQQWLTVDSHHAR